jgi:PPP family 3-phenylpropionic acid transporter
MNLPTKLPLFTANALVYSLLAVYYSFIPKYLKDIAEKSDGEIGVILSVGPLTGIVSMIIFGIVSDRAKYKNNVLVFILTAAAVMFYMVRAGNSLMYLVIVFTAFMFFMSPFGGLLDAVSLEYTMTAGIKYGPIRFLGSLCFGLISLFLTLVLSFFGDYINVTVIFPVFAVMALISAFSVKKIPPVKGHARGKKDIPYREFFRDKTCMTLFVFIFAMQFAFGSYYNFTQNYLEKELGQAPWVWGLTVFLTIVGELVFFLKFDYFFKRFSIKSMVLACVFMQFIRCLCFALLPYASGVLISSLITGSFGTVMMYAAAYYINLTVKKEMRAFGQTLMYSVGYYIPRALSGVAGGVIVERFGFNSLMLICAGMNLILFAASGFLPFKEPKKD